ncbi:Gfo/Idh/MocA family oxidoreductase [Alphaproteobacteria bacterium]|nr:Gfo/Idh/MocA family oxidoreductase [Alphaproteobacteria bacterium]
MKICLAGGGAFGRKHLDALALIDDVEIVSLVGRRADPTAELAAKYGIGHSTTNLDESLSMPEIDAVILATPTGMHAAQGLAVMDAGKHVLIEIPMADTLADSATLVAKQRETGLIAMAGHVRRFNPSHQYVHNLIKAGDFSIQQMDVQTYFFRRQNISADGSPRSWTDHLLWHHACHTIDLFMYQTGEMITEVHGLQGPIHPDLGIAMDMSIIMKTGSGKLCTLSLSFNNNGPLGTFFRYIGDNNTFVARYDDLFDGAENQIDVSDIDVSTNGIELIDREFIAAIREGREPNSSLAQCLPAMQVMDIIEKQFQG